MASSTSILSVRQKIQFLAGVLCLALSACGKEEELPATYLVAGKVIYTNKKPLTGGTIYFTLESNPELKAVAEIGPQGDFSLSTRVGNTKLPGAVAGKHSILILPEPDLNHQRISIRIIQPFVTVEEKDCNITIEIEQIE